MTDKERTRLQWILDLAHQAAESDDGDQALNAVHWIRYVIEGSTSEPDTTEIPCDYCGGEVTAHGCACNKLFEEGWVRGWNVVGEA